MPCRGRFRLFAASRWTRAILRGLASRFSWLQDGLSACQQVQRVLPFGGLHGRAGVEEFFHDHLCRASLPRERIDAAATTSMKSAGVWSGLAVVDPGPGGCRDSEPRRDEKQALPEGEVQAAVVG